jgi:hypothetical protein
MHHGWVEQAPPKNYVKGGLCLVQSARGRAALAAQGESFLRMRNFPLMLHASAENVTGALVILSLDRRLAFLGLVSCVCGGLR